MYLFQVLYLKKRTIIHFWFTIRVFVPMSDVPLLFWCFLLSVAWLILRYIHILSKNTPDFCFLNVAADLYKNNPRHFLICLTYQLLIFFSCFGLSFSSPFNTYFIICNNSMEKGGDIDPARLDYLMPWSENLPKKCREPRRS